jgi:hypothetical protein
MFLLNFMIGSKLGKIFRFRSQILVRKKLI